MVYGSRSRDYVNGVPCETVERFETDERGFRKTVKYVVPKRVEYVGGNVWVEVPEWWPTKIPPVKKPEVEEDVLP